MNLRNWFRSLTTSKTVTRSRKAASKRTPCCGLRVELLEDRAVPSTLSVAGVTVREGPTSLGVLDPSGAASVGLNGTRDITLRSNGDMFVSGELSHTVARLSADRK